jgi:hypothetical protein
MGVDPRPAMMATDDDDMKFAEPGEMGSVFGCCDPNAVASRRKPATQQVLT